MTEIVICYDLHDSWRYLDIMIYMDNWYRCMLKFTWTLQIHDGYTWVHMDKRNVRIYYMHDRGYVYACKMIYPNDKGI